MVVATLLFSLNPILYRQLTIQPVTILWSVNVVALATLSVSLMWQGRVRALAAIGPRAGLVALLAVCFTCNNALFISALLKTTVANATLAHYLAPVLVVFPGSVLVRERVGPTAVIAVLLSLAGLTAMLVPNALTLGNAHVLGLALGAGSAVFFALEIVLKKVLAKTQDADVLVARMLLISVLLLSPWCDYSALAGARRQEIGVLVCAGMVTSAFAISLFTGALRTVDAHRAAAISYLEPLGAIVCAALLIFEVPNRYELTGGLFIVAGTALVVWFDPSTQRPHVEDA